MERVKTRAERLEETLKPLSGKDIQDRRKTLGYLIDSENHWGNLEFFVFMQTEDVITVGIKRRAYGMWLFDANSYTEQQNQCREGLLIEENSTDMLLRGEHATIKEVNRRLPRFLARYYPDLVNSKRQKIQLQSPKKQLNQELADIP